MCPYDVGIPFLAVDCPALLDLRVRLNGSYEGLGALSYLWGWCSYLNRAGTIPAACARSASYFLPSQYGGTQRGLKLAQALIDSTWLEPHSAGLRVVPWQERAPGWVVEAHPVSQALAELREPGTPQEWSRATLADVYGRDGRRCRYCGVTEGQFSVDHIVPRSQGGGDDLINLAVCCRSCNSRKGPRTPQQAGMALLPVPGMEVA